MEDTDKVDTDTCRIFDDIDTTVEENIDELLKILSQSWFYLTQNRFIKDPSAKKIGNEKEPYVLRRLDQKLKKCITLSNNITRAILKLSKDVGSS